MISEMEMGHVRCVACGQYACQCKEEVFYEGSQWTSEQMAVMLDNDEKLRKQAVVTKRKLMAKHRPQRDQAAGINPDYKPPRRSIWERLGFGWCQPKIGFDDDDEAVHWYFGTTVVTHWDWKDRLRILISGKTLVRTAHRTEVEVERVRSASVSSVLPPGKLKPMASTIPEF